jgi:hypothetical protein
MSRYGMFGKHIELFDLWESYNDDPKLAREEMGMQEAEGTGAVETRADFPIFLQNVIRHRVRERFTVTASKWQQYMGVESAQDFREHTVSELGGITGIKPVLENGPYQRMHSNEQVGPSFAVAKHGGIYGVSMELIINDDANTILNRIPRQIGQTSAEYMSEVAVAFIESNPTYGPDGLPFFSGARGNEFTGTAADPTEDNLVTMIESMTLRRDATTGRPMNIEPRKILTRTTRTALRIQQILKSAQTTEQTGASVGSQVFARGSDNPLSYGGGIMPADAVIQETWLNDANDWYIFGNADNRPAFIMSFLRGQQAPFIGLLDPGVRSAMGAGTDPYSWEIDSIDYKSRLIFGTSVGEPLAAIRNRP